MVVIKLREAVLAYKRRTGQRMTYKILAERTGISSGTLEVMASKPGYNATIHILEKICMALDISYGDLLEIVPDPPELHAQEPKPKPKRPTRGKATSAKKGYPRKGKKF